MKAENHNRENVLQVHDSRTEAELRARLLHGNALEWLGLDAARFTP